MIKQMWILAFGLKFESLKKKKQKTKTQEKKIFSGQNIGILANIAKFSYTKIEDIRI